MAGTTSPSSLLEAFAQLIGKTSNDELEELARRVAREFADRADNYVNVLYEQEEIDAVLLVDATRFIRRAQRSFVQTLSNDDDVRDAAWRLLHAKEDLEDLDERAVA